MVLLTNWISYYITKLSYQNFISQNKIKRLLQEQVKILSNLPDGTLIVETDKVSENDIDREQNIIVKYMNNTFLKMFLNHVNQ